MSGSSELFERGRRVMPGGVNSPVRAFGSVGGTPPFIASGSGYKITDVDGRDFVDYVCSWGPLILGHAHPAVVEAIRTQSEKGSSFGAPTPGEVRLAEMLCERVPALEMVRLVSSGTEATMSALRLARAATGRDLVIKFEGCYHGHGDSFLIKGGSGQLTHGVPTSPGVPAALAELTLVATYNDIDSVRDLMTEHGDRVAAIIVEPVAGNMGVVPPAAGFLQGLRETCDRNGTLLIFDEVITGFRIAPGGATERYGVTPDLVTLGKVIGGGLPVGAYGGRRDLMELVSPLGPVYQAGTLSGNPLAVAAGIATLDQLASPGLYERLDEVTESLSTRISDTLDQNGVGHVINRVGSLFTLFFTDADRVEGYTDVMKCDSERFGRFFHQMMERGIYIAPSSFEAWFLSTAHDEEAIETTLHGVRGAIEALQN